jgi:hypothetical protein
MRWATWWGQDNQWEADASVLLGYLTGYACCKVVYLSASVPYPATSNSNSYLRSISGSASHDRLGTTVCLCRIIDQLVLWSIYGSSRSCHRLDFDHCNDLCKACLVRVLVKSLVFLVNLDGGCSINRRAPSTDAPTNTAVANNSSNKAIRTAYTTGTSFWP